MTSLHRHLPSHLPVGIATALTCLALTQLGPSIINGLPFSSLLGGQQPAHAQSKYNETEIANYVRAVIEIEANRIDAYETASDILTSSDSELSILDTPLKCTAARLSDMPDIPRGERVELRTVLVNFCNAASEIAEDNDLTPQKFNSMTAAYLEDEAIAEQIQSAISEL